MLLSSTKLALQRALEDSTVVDDPALEDQLLAAFPTPMRERFREDITGHRLRREIIATKLANRLVNRLGPVNPFELVEEEGVTLAQVAAAFAAAERLLDLPATWALLDSAPMAEDVRLMLFERVARALRGHVADLLRAGKGEERPGVLVARLAGGVEALTRDIADLLHAEARAQSQRIAAELAEAGAPADAAERVRHLTDMDGGIGLAELAADSGIDAAALTRAFTDLGERLGLDWAQQAASRLNPSDPWERLLAAGLARDFQQMRLDFLARAGTAGPGAAVAEWAGRNAAPVASFRALVARAQAAPLVGAAMLAQIAGQARGLLAR